MAQIPIWKLKETLHAAGVPSNQQYDVLARLRKTPSESLWHNLSAPLYDSIRTTQNGLARCRETRRETYAAYLALMRKTYTNITYAKMRHAKPSDATAEAAATNFRRAKEGRMPLGTCESHWSTWVPPHIREATVLAFERMYAEEASRKLPPGRRIHPFTTLTQRGEIQRKWKGLLYQVKPHIDAGFEIDPAYVEAHTRNMAPEQAEHLAHAMAKLHKERYRAAFAARKIIQQRMKATTTEFTVPLNWTHLLEPVDRAHLHEAERACGGDGYTRGVGIFSGNMLAPVPAAMAVEHGYIAQRPSDRFTALAQTGLYAKAQEEAQRDSAAHRAAEEWFRRIDEGNL